MYVIHRVQQQQAVSIVVTLKTVRDVLLTCTLTGVSHVTCTWLRDGDDEYHIAYASKPSSISPKTTGSPDSLHEHSAVWVRFPRVRMREQPYARKSTEQCWAREPLKISPCK